MIELTLPDLAIVGVLAISMPLVSAVYTIPRVRALAPEMQHQMRPSIYVQAMVMQWLFAGAALYVVVLRGQPWSDIGLGAIGVQQLVYGALVLLALGAAVLFMRRRVMQQPQGAAEVRAALARVEFILPRGKRQRRLWWLVSAHAGWGEELFYRGYLFALLCSLMPEAAAAVVSTVMFGLAHVYQGVRGIVMTTVLGGVFMGMYLLSGSLVVPMLAHALYDVYAGELGYWAFSRDDDAERPDNS